ncbi:DUF2793 domain-containing protein [Acuticoccus sp. M5D2P5]|uniref:DUF2793 domain-containing protein n=1 Tax=Acuticoccus kalidii TaxID=2910977 RepID=UPI001F33695F|nr:DUF2793 domain-containing protein [Acuticoccus kalidii]MCF3934450.1 DUF2793 domain-containing protein [Acuticoccus kalidii]
MSSSLNLELPYVEAAQAQKHVTVNDALRRIDAIVQLSVADRSRTSPPGAPSEGDRHIVAPGASGAWSGEARSVAAYADGAWVFFEPKPGWIAFVEAEEAIVYYDGSAWEILAAADDFEVASKLGINGAADATNRLVVNAEASLFAPDNTQPVPTGDVRVKVTKTAAGDVASHLFQTNFSGRAEFGLIGSDDFSLKVSPNGSSFTEAFKVNRNTAVVNFTKIPAIGGNQAFGFSLRSRTAIASTNIPADVQQLEVRGFAGENDGGAGRYQRVGSFPSDGLGVTDAAGGHWALLGNVVNVRQTGAVGDGTTDDTAAINAALASGRTVEFDRGVFYVTDALRTGTSHQRMYGDGRGRTTIKVTPTFNMSALGVFQFDHSFVFLEDLEVDFDQSPASSRATLVQYPPAVYMVNRTRCRLSRLRFIEAYDGVLASGNTGGALFEDVESGSFNEGFHIDGALDSVELRNCRVWPYNFAGNPTLDAIYEDGQTIAFRIGRCDDFKMSNCTPFQSRILLEESASGHRPFGTINGLALDGSYSRIEMSAGDMAITSLYATTSVGNDRFINQTGGTLVISDFSFRVGEYSNVPMVQVSGIGTKCQIQNGTCEFGGSVGADGFRVSDGQMSVSSVRFSLNPTVARTGSCIRQVGGELLAIGNSVNGITTGSGSFIRVQTNGNHVIMGNDSNGWAYDFPVSKSAGIYGPNHNGSATVIDSTLTLGPSDGSNEGGELRLAGAGSNGVVALDNWAGNARFLQFAAGKTLQVITPEGATQIGGDKVDSAGLRIWRGAGSDHQSIGVGALALEAVTGGISNTAVGRRALTALTGGDENTALGTNSGSSMTNVNGNTVVGYNAGTGVTGGGNTAIGRNALNGSSGISNCAALGDGATVTGSNQVQLGNSSTTTYVYGSVQSRSDGRDKADVRDTLLGLDFVNRLRPVDFRWDYREDYETGAAEPGALVRTRFHHGFIAQDVASVIDALGVDFGGYQDHALAGGQDVKSIGYCEFFAPVVKAIQELSARLDAIEAAPGG